jgi:cobalt/nickel transport system permease protein
VHIPDGFISPQTYLPALALSGVLWAVAAKKIALEVEKIPLLGGVSAIAFVLMLIALPLPGGTTVHLGGVAIIALLFGPWTAFVALSMVLALQALLFGEGGITSYSVNVLAIAFGGSFSAYGTWYVLRRFKRVAMIASGFAATIVPALIVAVALGIQPLIASHDGRALYFPFDLHVTLPAVMLPHLFLGIVEGFVTLSAVTFLKSRFRNYFES